MKKVRFSTDTQNNKFIGKIEWKGSDKILDEYLIALQLYKKDIGRGVSNLRLLQSYEPDFFPVLNSIGKYYLSIKNYSEALLYFLDAYQQVIPLLPNNFKGRFPFHIHLNQYFILTLNGLMLTYLKLDQIDESLSILKKLMQYDPEGHLLNKYRRGTIFYKCGKFREAEKIFQSVNTFAPYNYLFGKHLFDSGKIHEAILQLCFGMMRDNYICEKIINCVYYANLHNVNIYKKLSREFIRVAIPLFDEKMFKNFLTQIFESQNFQNILDPYQTLIQLSEVTGQSEKYYHEINQKIRVYKNLPNPALARKIYDEIKFNM